MNLALRHLKTIGCQASGLLSDEDDLVKAVRSETQRHDYDEVILATGRQDGSSLARVLHRDPVHQLRPPGGGWSNSRAARPPGCVTFRPRRTIP